MTRTGLEAPAVAYRGARLRPAVSILLASGGIVAGACGLYLLAIASSTWLLVETAQPEPVDTIVVLGGDGPPRARKASELWSAGLARQVIVAGAGDCHSIRAAIVERGVPSSAIAVECLSSNTWMNAVNAAQLLQGTHTRTALLVTSWFHTGRALRAFRLRCPGIRWIPAATPPPSSLLETATGPYGPAIAKEYVKAAAYRLREWLQPPARLEPDQACLQENVDWMRRS